MSTGSRLLAAASVVAAAAAAIVLYRYDPLRVAFYPRCPLYVFTGLYCPGCGALRALHALLHLRVAAAFGYNALLVPALPVFAYLGISRLRKWMGRPALPTVFLPASAVWGILVLLVGFATLRNLPFAPFTLLAP